MVPDGKSVAPAARRWSDRARDEHFAAIGPDLHAKLADVVATFVTARTRPLIQAATGFSPSADRWP
jgi:hypothetical protein